MFHTPPIHNRSYDPRQSILESYRSNSNSSDPGSSTALKSLPTSETIGGTPDLSLLPVQANDDLSPSDSFPEELLKLIDVFIDDLKQPKYSRPLNILQLSHVFQQFYLHFDRSSYQYYSVKHNGTSINMICQAHENRNSGLSSIFNRSRSSSLRGGTNRSRTRTNSQHTYQQLFTPEEVEANAKQEEIRDRQVEKVMLLCENEVFKKILQVGTSVPSDTKHLKCDCDTWRLTNLFRNSPEFVDFDKLLEKKLLTVKDLDGSGLIDLRKFLSIKSISETDLNKLQDRLDGMIYNRIAPCDKVLALEELHEELAKLEHKNADEILPQLIYLFINRPRKELFLNLQFIKLFRYHRCLKEKELYVTTNMEAAISFIDSLNSDDLLPFSIGVEKSDLPKLVTISSQVTLTTDCDSQIQSEFKRSNSFSDLRSVSTVIDSGLKSLIGRIKSYTPPPQQPSPIPFQQDPSTELPVDWKRWKSSSFEDLKVSDLQKIFEIYQQLAKNSK